MVCNELLVLLLLHAGGRASGCTSTLDCSLNGDCVDGVCDCDPAWKGDQCHELFQLPVLPGTCLRGVGVESGRPQHAVV